jgi:hypothetical protein
MKSSWRSAKSIKVTWKKMLRSFIRQYNPRTSYIVNMSLKQTVEIEKTKVYSVPFYELMALEL